MIINLVIDFSYNIEKEVFEVLKNRKGMAMPAVLMVLLIVTILGAALLRVAVADSIHASRDRSRMQAYYLARSGVEATETWILDNTASFNSIKDKTSSPATIPESGIDGTFTVKVTGSLSNIVLIEATGTVKGVTATATKALISSGDILDDIVFDDTVYAKNLVVLSGNVTIDGTVAYGGSITTNGSTTITGGPPVQKDRELPSPIFPADPTTSTLILNLKNDAVLNNLADFNTTNKMLVAKTFDYNANKKTLTVNTGSTGDVVRLVTNTFDFNGGSLILTGTGRFELYVTGSMSLGAGVALNEGGSAKQFLVLMGEGSSFTKAGNASFTGVIYGPQANVTVNGTDNFTGAVIGENTTLSGNPFSSPGDAGDLTFDDLPIVLFYESNYINN